MILDVTFKRVVVICMHYHIFIIDGGFEPVCVTLICIAPRFHELLVDSDNDRPVGGRKNAEIT